MSREIALAMAQAYRRAADALEEGRHLALEHCGIPLDVAGQCQHRPGHHTLTDPDPAEIRQQVLARQAAEAEEPDDYDGYIDWLTR